MCFSTVYKQTGILVANTGALVVCLAVCMIHGKTLAHVL